MSYVEKVQFSHSIKKIMKYFTNFGNVIHIPENK